MTDDTRISFNDVWNELNVKDKGLRFEFELNGYNFWIESGSGLLRRLVAAERLLQKSWVDPNGVAAGDYDNLADSIMDLVSLRIKNDDEDELIKLDSKWRETIIPLFDEALQIDMLLNLPYSAAAVILGEKRASMAMGAGLTLHNSEALNEE